jgi:hypothetical protein
MVKLVEVGTSLGVGIVDNVLVELEEQGKITGNLVYAKDAFRIGSVAVGAVLSTYTYRYSDIGDALLLSATPLAMHSVRRLVKSQFRYPGKVVVVPSRPVSVTPVPAPAPSAGARIVSY